MSFIQTLHNIDNNVLLFINGNHTPFLDKILWIVSERTTWIPLYLLFGILIFRNYRKKPKLTPYSLPLTPLLIILFAVLAVILSDQIADFIKNEVMRPRPSHTIGLMQQLHYYNEAGTNYMGGAYGFVSNHAANAASLTCYLALLFRNKFVTCGLIFWTLLLCYSRVYLGVHFPSDVLGGILVGLVSGFIAFGLWKFVPKFF